MPPKLPQGMRYAPKEPAPAPRTTDRAAAVPESLVPAAPFPEASGTTLPALPPAFYPGAGPTEFGWTYGALQGVVFPGSTNTWTAIQTFRLSDHATGSDSPALRPDVLYYDHLTDQAPVPGIGASLTYRGEDVNHNLINVTSICSEITQVTPVGQCEGTVAFCVLHQGQMCEAFRARGQLGMAATANAGGVYGFLGGQLWARGDFYACAAGEGKAGFGTLPVSGAMIAIQSTADNLKGLIIRAPSPDDVVCPFEIQTSTGTPVISFDPNGNFLGDCMQIVSRNVGVGALSLQSAPGETGTVFTTIAADGGNLPKAQWLMRASGAMWLALTTSNPGSIAVTGSITPVWFTNTAGSQAGSLVFEGWDATHGPLQFMRGGTNGSVAALGVLGAAMAPRQTVTGSRGGNAALASLLTAMALFGWITDSTSA